MAIVFFRNQLDANMKRFGKFSKKIYNSLSPNFPVSLVYHPSKIKYLEALNATDTFIIIAHGSPGEVYHHFKQVNASHVNLIDIITPPTSIGKIIAISCSTARTLGPFYVNNGLCKAYLGFSTKLHFNKKKSRYNFVSPYYSRELKEIYKSVFEKVLVAAISEGWTFEKTARVMRYELRKTAAMRVRTIQKQFPHYYKAKEINQILVAVASVANGITVLGNGNEFVS